MLLIYAGLPFVEEHLIFSYNRVCKKEFAAIWVMVLTNAIAGFFGLDISLLLAMLVGVVLSLFIFMLQYYRTRSIREIRDGESFQSVVLRPYMQQKLLENLGCRLKIMVLQVVALPVFACEHMYIVVLVPKRISIGERIFLNTRLLLPKFSAGTVQTTFLF